MPIVPPLRFVRHTVVTTLLHVVFAGQAIGHPKVYRPLLITVVVLILPVPHVVVNVWRVRYLLRWVVYVVVVVGVLVVAAYWLRVLIAD